MVLQVGPLLVLGTLAFQVLVLFGGALEVVQEEDVLSPLSLPEAFAAEFVALEFLCALS